MLQLKRSFNSADLRKELIALIAEQNRLTRAKLEFAKLCPLGFEHAELSSAELRV